MSFFSPAIPPALAGIFQSIAAVWNAVWWIVLPVIGAIIFWEAWLIYLHYYYVTHINWKFLEIKVPKNILTTPKAMEQIFAAAHAPYSYGMHPWDRYWKGNEEPWMAFELIAKAGETHFYLRVPDQFRNMMEAAIYAQYPEAEITPANDYLDELPEVLPNDEFDVSGFEEILRHPGYIPIRTYILFEDPVEERRLDPIAELMEIMSKLKDDEQLWFQVIVQPTGEDFKNEGEKVVNKMLGIEAPPKPKLFSWPHLGFTLADVVRSPFAPPLGPQAGADKQQKAPRFFFSPTEQARADAIHQKISKIAFTATLRFMFIERRAQARPTAGVLNSIHGFIRQFNTQHLNQLKPDGSSTTASYAVRGLFKQMRVRWRKRMIFESYRYIVPSGNAPVLNVEELATVFHFPITTVKPGELQKIESRKGSPPANLPTIEE